MHTTSQKVMTNKKRLGRGLGSLLSTGADEFEAAPSRPTSNENLEATPKSAPVPTPAPTSNIKQTVITAPAPAPIPEVVAAPEPEIVAPVVEEAAPVVVEPEVVPEKLSNFYTIDNGMRIWSLAIEKVFPNPTQPRKDFLKEPLEELSLSIKEQGVLQPITVRKKDDKYEIIAGERRWRASQLAGLQEIPAIIKDVDNQKSMELALIENLQREDLNSLEEAMGYQNLIEEYRMSQQEVATKVGKSRTSITNALRVLTLPRDVREMLRQNLISVGHAKVLLSVEDSKTQVTLAKKVIHKQLSVRALEKEINKVRGGDDTESSGSDSLHSKQAQILAGELQKALGTKVEIVYREGKGSVAIAFYSDEELSNISEKIKNGCIIGL